MVFTEHPEIVIAGDEQDFPEPRRESAEAPFQETEGVGDVAGENEHIVLMIRNGEVRNPSGVRVVVDVDVRDSKDAHQLRAAATTADRFF